MNEVLTLWAVLLLIYLLECLSLVPEEDYVFRARWVRQWKPGKSLLRMGRRHTQIYVSHPIPGFGDIAISSSAARPDPGTEKDLQKMLDTRAVRRRVRAYRRVLLPLYWDACLMAVIIVFLFPVVALRFGLWISLALIPVFLIGVVHMVAAFRRVHRAFTPDLVAERREKTISLLMSPLGAIRVPAFLLRGATAGFHPLAVAAATMPPVDARKVASKILRQIQFEELDREPSGVSGDPASVEWRTVVREWATREFGDIEALVGAPVKRYEDSISYCPRCEEEYLLEAGACSDCPGISLKLFPPARALSPARSRRGRGRR